MQMVTSIYCLDRPLLAYMQKQADLVENRKVHGSGLKTGCVNSSPDQIAVLGILPDGCMNEQAGAILNDINDWAGQVIRDSRTTVTSTQVALTFNQRFRYIIGAMHYNGPAERIVIDSFLQSG